MCNNNNEEYFKFYKTDEDNKNQEFDFYDSNDDNLDDFGLSELGNKADKTESSDSPPSIIEDNNETGVPALSQEEERQKRREERRKKREEEKEKREKEKEKREEEKEKKEEENTTKIEKIEMKESKINIDNPQDDDGTFLEEEEQYENNNNTWLLLLLSLFFVLLVGGYFGYQYLYNDNEPIPIPPTIAVDSTDFSNEPAELEPEPEPEPEPEEKLGSITEITERTGKTYIIVSSSIDGDLARDSAKGFRDNGYDCYIIHPFKFRGNNLTYRVAIASFDTVLEASNNLDKYRAEIVPDAWVIKY